ncbi:DUF1700 domain-containing protein [Fictibacillus sp. Mic-4]|uniref:HAAS signaling domain-containing protein n=1 Tax=Fictibacillus sp. Mic-4 TaxID=3132826 RepID=UPI003CEC399F
MTKKQFISELGNFIKKLPEGERKEIIYDYEEHFEMGMAEGKAEHEIANELGSPKTLAREILAQYHLSQAQSDKSMHNMMKALLAIVSLSFFNIVFLLMPIIVILVVYAVLCIASFAIATSGIGVLSPVFLQDISFMERLFMAMALTGFGVFMCIVMIYIGKFLYRMILNYARFNVRIVKGERS